MGTPKHLQICRTADEMRQHLRSMAHHYEIGEFNHADHPFIRYRCAMKVNGQTVFIVAMCEEAPPGTINDRRVEWTSFDGAGAYEDLVSSSPYDMSAVPRLPYDSVRLGIMRELTPQCSDDVPQAVVATSDGQYEVVRVPLRSVEEADEAFSRIMMDKIATADYLLSKQAHEEEVRERLNSLVDFWDLLPDAEPDGSIVARPK